MNEALNESQHRTVLLDQQAGLLRALVGRQESPAEFDPFRLQAAARALARKRCHAAAKAWPSLTNWLAIDFQRKFAAYAQASSLPAHGGPLADGCAFAHYLARSEKLPNEVRLAQFAIGLRYAWHRTGLHPRRGPALKALLLRKPLRLVLGLRLPIESDRYGTIVRVLPFNLRLRTWSVW